MDVEFGPVKELRRRLAIYMDEFHKEHNLINNRLNWLTTSQSFLIAAEVVIDQHGTSYPWPIRLIPYLGLFVSTALMFSIFAALKAQSTLTNGRNKIIDQFFSLHTFTDEQKSILIEPFGIRGPSIHKFGMISVQYIPHAFIVFWFIVILYHLVSFLSANLETWKRLACSVA